MKNVFLIGNDLLFKFSGRPEMHTKGLIIKQSITVHIDKRNYYKLFSMYRYLNVCVSALYMSHLYIFVYI